MWQWKLLNIRLGKAQFGGQRGPWPYGDIISIMIEFDGVSHGVGLSALARPAWLNEIGVCKPFRSDIHLTYISIVNLEIR
jgi:hypothetical protein